MRRCLRPTSTKSGSRLAAQTAAKWPTTQMARPTSQRRRPRPTAPAKVPFMMAMERGAPPSRMCSVSARWTCTAHQQPCRWCGAAVCGPCSQGGLCSLCRSLEPLEDPAELKRLLASLQAHGRVVRGFQTVRTARSGLRTLVVFGWRFGGEEFYSLGPEGLALPRRRRALGRFLNSDTEPLP